MPDVRSATFGNILSLRMSSTRSRERSSSIVRRRASADENYNTMGRSQKDREEGGRHGMMKQERGALRRQTSVAWACAFSFCTSCIHSFRNS
jgi:hypothetical protein